MAKKRNNTPNQDRETLIKDNHYQWCLDNGRDTGWYFKNKK
jgi:hypothetical protein